MNRWTYYAVIWTLTLGLSFAATPVAWADDSDDDDLGVDSFDVLDDSDDVEGSFLELEDLHDDDSDDLDGDSDSDSDDSDDEDSDSDDSDGDLDDSDSEDDSDEDLDGDVTG